MFFGLTLRVFGSKRLLLLLPALLVIPVDLLEGFVQVLILSGNDEVVSMKEWVTPLKLLLFILAILIAVMALFVARKRRNDRGEQ